MSNDISVIVEELFDRYFVQICSEEVKSGVFSKKNTKYFWVVRNEKGQIIIRGDYKSNSRDVIFDFRVTFKMFVTTANIKYKEFTNLFESMRKKTTDNEQ